MFQPVGAPRLPTFLAGPGAGAWPAAAPAYGAAPFGQDAYAAAGVEAQLASLRATIDVLMARVAALEARQAPPPAPAANPFAALVQRIEAALRRPPSEAAPPAPAPAPAAPLPPITQETVKEAAREYVAAHPEIAEKESYEETAYVAQLREGVIAMLAAKGYRVGRIHGPDGKPYDQMIAFGNPTDPDAHAYRVTAGGGPIRRAITVGYCDENIPWSHVH